MVSINNLQASDGSGEAVRANVTVARTSGSATITVDAVTNWPTDAFIGTTGSLNPDGTLDSSTTQVFYGHITSGKIVIDSFAPGYTDLGNEVNDVVLLKPTTAWSGEIKGIFDVSLADDGTLNTTAQASRRIPRIHSQTSTSTLAPNIDTYNYERITALAANLSISAPTGTPNDGDGLLIEITDAGTAKTLTWDATFISQSQYGLTLPTASAGSTSKTIFLTFVYNSALTSWVAVL